MVHRRPVWDFEKQLAEGLRSLLLRVCRDARMVFHRCRGGSIAHDHLRYAGWAFRTAYEVAQLLVQFDSPRIVKAWFIGLNPQLDDVSLPRRSVAVG